MEFPGLDFTFSSKITDIKNPGPGERWKSKLLSTSYIPIAEQLIAIFPVKNVIFGKKIIVNFIFIIKFIMYLLLRYSFINRIKIID